MKNKKKKIKQEKFSDSLAVIEVLDEEGYKIGDIRKLEGKAFTEPYLTTSVYDQVQALFTSEEEARKYLKRIESACNVHKPFGGLLHDE
jgi:hypothetical protein